MIKLIRVILGIIVIVISGYNLITKDFELMPYLMLFLGAFMLASGFIELQKDRKGIWGYMSIIVSLFIFFVSIQGFWLK
ncbi:DUF3953 domain-containing protein [Brevibacillus daliensis]|uniref:DUF3953 domain-containing protein n=1 Tax=Brevibacillus daliensis TaxID=2892995 RepID=UPI001E51F7D3|nr:DUF3953 domain-containing protein [Brevibacillus daliensis]